MYHSDVSFVGALDMSRRDVRGSLVDMQVLILFHQLLLRRPQFHLHLLLGILDVDVVLVFPFPRGGGEMMSRPVETVMSSYPNYSQNLMKTRASTLSHRFLIFVFVLSAGLSNGVESCMYLCFYCPYELETTHEGNKPDASGSRRRFCQSNSLVCRVVSSVILSRLPSLWLRLSHPTVCSYHAYPAQGYKQFE